MAIVEVSINPIGAGSASVSDQVAQAVRVLDAQKDLKYQVAPMGTVIEGSLDKVLPVIQKMHHTVLSGNIQRVLTIIVIDDRHDKVSTMESKVNAVKSKLRK